MARRFRLGVVEGDTHTAVPPTLTIAGRTMRYLIPVSEGQTAVYFEDDCDPIVIGKVATDKNDDE